MLECVSPLHFILSSTKIRVTSVVCLFDGVQVLFVSKKNRIMLTKKNKEAKTFTNAGITGKYQKKEAPSDVPSKFNSINIYIPVDE